MSADSSINPVPIKPEAAESRPAPDLSPFAGRNPEATLELGEDAVLISRPWGDDSIVIRVAHEATVVVEALNNLRLPPRFSAIWHNDTNDLEFIFAPIRVDHPVRQRRFTFEFAGRALLCEYANASERLVPIANAFRPTGHASDTDLRNLHAVRNFQRVRKVVQESANPVEVELTSFWIRSCDVPETDLVELARHINFYTRYFDRQVPRILIHEKPVKLAVERPERYPFGEFPATIAARRLDPYLITLWESHIDCRSSALVSLQLPNSRIFGLLLLERGSRANNSENRVITRYSRPQR